jgi:hypothetical protein
MRHLVLSSRPIRFGLSSAPGPALPIVLPRLIVDRAPLECFHALAVRPRDQVRHLAVDR